MLAPKSYIQALFLASALGSMTPLHAEEDKTKVLDLNQVDMEQVDDNWDNQSQVPKVRADNGLKIKDIVEPTSEYTYASFGKADPFTMPLLASPTDAAAGGTITEAAGDAVPGAAPGSKEITVNSPLQAYPLNALMVKVVWQTMEGEFRAIIQTPKNEGIVVKNGDPIASGKILTISKEEILVRLYKLRADGVREYDDSKMTFGHGTKITKATIKLEPGKEAQFPGMEKPADLSGSDNAAGKTNVVKAPAAGNKAAPAAAPANNAAAAPASPGATAPKAEGADAKKDPAPLGWPYNNAPAQAAPAPTSNRPGASVR